MATTAIILAAGQGTRMKSRHTKIVHNMLNLPLICWSVRAMRNAGAQRIIVVVGHQADEVKKALVQDGANDVIFAEQKEQKGTAHAVRCALDACEINNSERIIIGYGDTPLMRPQTIAALLDKLENKQAACALLTMHLDDATGYGRIIFDVNNHIQAIVEHKDCTDQQREALHECNSGIYAFRAEDLKKYITEISCDNAQQEYYLTDMVALLNKAQKTVLACHTDDSDELLGVNSRIQLAQATRIMQKRINEQHMAQGITMLDPESVWIGPDVTIEMDCEILPQTMLWGNTHIQEGSVIGPNTRLTNTQVGKNCIVDETVAQEALLENDVCCGPRAYLRPGAHLLDGSKAGTHVEIKNSTIGCGSKVPHLSYIGDTTMGNNVNIGAGSITCNYDGMHKNKTIIGDNVFVGSDTMMVAPVCIEDGALIGAGSTITQDVPANALALERSEQKIVEGYAQTRRERMQKKEQTSC